MKRRRFIRTLMYLGVTAINFLDTKLAHSRLIQTAQEADPLFWPAFEYLMAKPPNVRRKTPISHIQIHFRMNYSRAKRIVDEIRSYGFDDIGSGRPD